MHFCTGITKVKMARGNGAWLGEGGRVLARLVSDLCSSRSRTDKVAAVDSYVYNDVRNDVFQREPFVVRFTSSTTCE